MDVLNQITDRDYETIYNTVPELKSLIKKFVADAKGKDQTLMMEFLLHGLSEFSQISKKSLASGIKFNDLVGSMFNYNPEDEA